MDFLTKLFFRNILFSRHGFLIAAVAIALFCIAIAEFIYVETETEFKNSVEKYRVESHQRSILAQGKIETAFQNIYHNLRTISRLPSVREIDRHAQNLSANEGIVIQEIYNNLADSVDVSEVYVLPKEFNPEAIDPVTGKTEAPIIVFDDLIVGRTAEDYAAHKSDKLKSPVEEIEIHEYRLMREQIAWMGQHYPALNKISGQDFPAIGGREVITCDNSHYSPAAPNDADRSGTVYSVPFYDMQGNFKGMVSAIFLTSMLRDLMPEADYALINTKHHQHVLARKPSETLANSKGWIEKEVANPDLIYSEVLPLSIKDSEGEWKLWIGLPNAAFYADGRNVQILEFRNWACASVLLFGLFAITGLALFRRHQLRVEETLRRAKENAEAESAKKSRFLSNIIGHAVDGLITVDAKGIVQSFSLSDISKRNQLAFL